MIATIFRSFLRHPTARSYFKDIDKRVSDNSELLQCALQCHVVCVKHNYSDQMNKFYKTAIIPNIMDSYLFNSDENTTSFDEFKQSGFVATHQQANMNLCALLWFRRKDFLTNNISENKSRHTAEIMRSEPLKLFKADKHTIIVANNDAFSRYKTEKIKNSDFHYNYSPIFYDEMPVTNNAKNCYVYKFYDSDYASITDEFIAPFGLWKVLSTECECKGDMTHNVIHLIRVENIIPIPPTTVDKYFSDDSNNTNKLLKKMLHVILPSKL